MERKRLSGTPPVNGTGGDYFPDESKSTEFIPSGCAVLDCVLGGGWAEGRIANIVGDKSTGKTLLAIEACANFSKKYARGRIWYREAEAAFDEYYAAKLGLPIKRMDFGEHGLGTQWSTVEDIWDDLNKAIAICKRTKQPGLYIVDSLDALTSRAAMSRKVGEGSFNLEKQKILSQMFSELIRDLRDARITILIISQVRDKIGFVVGEKHRRSGGKALDFYATQIVWLSHLKNLVRTLDNIKRVTAVRVRAKCKKNKVTMPSRDCDFTIRFGFGVEDIEASVEWLEHHKKLDLLGLRVKDIDGYLAEAADMPGQEYQVRAAEVRQAMFAAWTAVEKKFGPTHSKYG